MADLDIIDLTEAQVALRVTNPELEPEVQALVSGLSEKIDDWCGPVVAREVDVTLSGPYSGPLLLTTTPVLEVVTVTETTGTSPVELTADDWQLDAQGHYVRLFRRSGGIDSSWVVGSRNIAVTVNAGRFADTESVSAGWKSSFVKVLRAKWQAEAPAWAKSPNMPTGDDPYDPPYDEDALIRATFSRHLLPPGIA